MKPYDILQTAIVELQVPQAVVLIGEDTVLKRIVFNRLIEAVAKDDRESHDVKSAEQLSGILTESSIFGSRLLTVSFDGKWGKIQSLGPALTAFKETDDCLILRTLELPTGQTFDHLWAVCECKKPSNKKQREKMISVLAPLYGVKFFEDAQKKFAERAEETSQIESALLTLSLAINPHFSVTVADVTKVLKDQSQRKDILRAFLRHNIPRISKEVAETDSPPYTLTILHSTLLRAYTWLEMLEAEVKEDEISELLKIPPRFRREWRLVKEFYSNRAIREVLESTADAYSASISGRPWQEKLQKALEKLI